MAGAPLAGGVGVRQGRGPARRPVDDRRVRRAPRRVRPPALGRPRDPAAGRPPRRRLQARRPARVRVRGLAPREDRNVGALRLTRARPRHRPRHVVAAGALLDQPRAGRARRHPVHREGAS